MPFVRRLRLVSTSRSRAANLLLLLFLHDSLGLESHSGRRWTGVDRDFLLRGYIGGRQFFLPPEDHHAYDDIASLKDA